MCPVPFPWHAMFCYNSQAARHMAHTQLPYLYLWRYAAASWALQVSQGLQVPSFLKTGTGR